MSNSRSPSDLAPGCHGKTTHSEAFWESFQDIPRHLKASRSSKTPLTTLKGRRFDVLKRPVFDGRKGNKWNSCRLSWFSVYTNDWKRQEVQGRRTWCSLRVTPTVSLDGNISHVTRRAPLRGPSASFGDVLPPSSMFPPCSQRRSS